MPLPKTDNVWKWVCGILAAMLIAGLPSWFSGQMVHGDLSTLKESDSAQTRMLQEQIKINSRVATTLELMQWRVKQLELRNNNNGASHGSRPN